MSDTPDAAERAAIRIFMPPSTLTTIIREEILADLSTLIEAASEMQLILRREGFDVTAAFWDSAITDFMRGQKP